MSRYAPLSGLLIEQGAKMASSGRRTAPDGSGTQQMKKRGFENCALCEEQDPAVPPLPGHTGDTMPQTETLVLGIDATSAARRRTGIGHYTAAIIEQLARRKAPTRLFTWGLRATGKLPCNLSSDHHIRLPGKLLMLSWHHLRWPVIDGLVPEADVIFSPNYLLFPTGKPLMVTIHDLFFVDGGGQDYWSGRFLKNHLQKYLSREASAIVVDSFATKRRLLDWQPTLESVKVEVVYPGIKDRFLVPPAPGEKRDLRNRLRLPEEYLLCVGELSRRKNQLRLLEAMSRLDKSPPPLVLCGLSDAGRLQALRAAEALSLASSAVFILPYLDEGDLWALMGGAHAVICPSLDEGFGLPVLEALALGVPVACSDSGALPEVAGEVAEMFGPLEASSMVMALERVIWDEESREAQHKSGPAWARTFSYERTVEMLLEAARRLRL